ncbi:MAG TPA: hypothetical protein VI306_08545 [Pyrinomonadaceae bacterium]
MVPEKAQKQSARVDRQLGAKHAANSRGIVSFEVPKAQPTDSGTDYLSQAVINSEEAAGFERAIKATPPGRPLITSVGTTITVSTSSDNADGDSSSIAALIATPGPDSVISLREAITAANNTPGADTINFQIPGAGVKTITLTSALPAITGPVTIDGYTQNPCISNPVPSCSKPNTLAVGSDAVLLIELKRDNNSDSSNPIGLNLEGGNSIVRGLVINSFNGSGIQIHSDGNTVAGCFIGTDPSGMIASENVSNAVTINGTDNNITVKKNVIGGAAPADRNLLSGNGNGVFDVNGHGVDINGANATDNTVLGNLIGTNKDGTSALSNAHVGVKIEGGASNNIVGGTTGTTPGGGCTGACNVISGNGQQGVTMFGAGEGNRILGNFIGTNATGTAAVPNGNTGVLIAAGSSDEVVGGNSSAARNVISGNKNGEGVGIEQFPGPPDHITVQGNFIGTTSTGTAPLPNDEGITITGGANCVIGGTAAGTANVLAFNTHRGIVIFDPNPTVSNTTGNAIRGNSIHDNGDLGIDLFDPNVGGIAPNDVKDTDLGPNALQNFPLITSATASVGAGNINGTLNSTPGQLFAIDFYANASCDSSGNGEGNTYVGSLTTGITDSNGDVLFTFVSPPLSLGQVITATATDVSGNTSEFSNCVTVTSGCITTQPPDQTVCAGSTASFSVSSGASPTFQWRKGGVNLSNDGHISGADTPTLIIRPTLSTDAGPYDVVVNGTCNPPNISSSAILTVNAAPSVTTNPAAQVACSSSNVSFVAAASGSPAPTVQWQVSSDGGASFSDIAGETNTTLTLTASASNNGNQYRAVFTNLCNVATTSAATLTVNGAQSVTANPSNQTVCPGSVTFTAAASGSPAPGVKWQVSTDGGLSFCDLAGKTDPTLTFLATTSDNGNQYRAVFTFSCNVVATNAATLIVHTPIAITSCPPAKVTVPADKTGLVVIPDLTGKVAATFNCGSPQSISQFPVAGTKVGPAPTLVTVTIKDTVGNTSTCPATINADDDSDGIENSLDINQSADEFVRLTSVSRVTNGSIKGRGGWNVRVIPSSLAGGVQASISGSGTVASFNAFDNPNALVELTSAGQIVDLTRNYPQPFTQEWCGSHCSRTRIEAIRTTAHHPILVKRPWVNGTITSILYQGGVLYIGNPITADPSNQIAVAIEISHKSGAVLGSIQLSPAQTVNIEQGTTGETVFTNLGTAPLTLNLNGIFSTLSPNQTLRPAIGPRAIYQETLNDIAELRRTVTDERDREKLDKVIGHLRAAFDPRLSTDAFHLQPKGGKKVFDEAKDVVNLLLHLTRNNKSSLFDATLQGFIAVLINASRQLADIAINEAVGAGGAQRQIKEANDELKKGDREDAELLHIKFKSAIDHYRQAWKHAMNATDKR